MQRFIIGRDLNGGVKRQYFLERYKSEKKATEACCSAEWRIACSKRNSL